jgi:hypothetical protein
MLFHATCLTLLNQTRNTARFLSLPSIDAQHLGFSARIVPNPVAFNFTSHGSFSTFTKIIVWELYPSLAFYGLHISEHDDYGVLSSLGDTLTLGFLIWGR